MSWEKEADVGTRNGAQRRGAEADGWRVRSTSSWAALCTERGGGERVKNERDLSMNGYRWGRGGTEQGK